MTAPNSGLRSSVKYFGRAGCGEAAATVDAKRMHLPESASKMLSR
jgi:hypothetical protein